MEVRDILKNRRLQLGLTMKEVAEAVGVSEATISRWESGDIANMKRNKIAALANVLQLSPSVIMGWEEMPTYYFNPETAKMAQDIFENKDLQILFDAARDSRPVDLQMAAEMLRRFKETNRDT